MKKLLLCAVAICVLAPVEMVSAAPEASNGFNFITSLFVKKKNRQPKFRQASMSVYKKK